MSDCSLWLTADWRISANNNEPESPAVFSLMDDVTPIQVVDRTFVASKLKPPTYSLSNGTVRSEKTEQPKLYRYQNMNTTTRTLARAFLRGFAFIFCLAAQSVTATLFVDMASTPLGGENFEP